MAHLFFQALLSLLPLLVSTASHAPPGPPMAIGATYYGGEVMRDPITVYLIWYGKFTEGQKGIVRNFIRSLSPSKNASVTVPLWWNINRVYYDKKGTVSATVRVGTEVNDVNRSQGNLTGYTSVWSVVQRAIERSGLPVDAGALYAVMSDQYTTQSGAPTMRDSTFCGGYCAWHFYEKYKSKQLKYLFVGDPRRCMSDCGLGPLQGAKVKAPGGDKGLAAMVNFLAHEIAEATTDPDFNSWQIFGPPYNENGDACAGSFGKLLGDGNTVYNLVGVNGSKFLIQQNFDITIGGCALTRPYPK